MIQDRGYKIEMQDFGLALGTAILSPLASLLNPTVAASSRKKDPPHHRGRERYNL
jgi:hypothetical protein